ncbi:cell wall hydrolase [Paracoccus aerodenitrificans]|uniref:cell wall hydrolase n=1 Tax=Paracoccus aerodenitrificans TaxID=3017781 RepID=UPI0022F03849|nr:cell wall hydrolase [Paracoccus aerodenitrificans]WBU65650.1 cell wall hydrolase [Paracoccus aerodenitrificans]
MERAMYFESNRSSRDGMIAVGSVVMNRVRSDDFPNSVCGVVGQKNQFAPGVMTKKMDSRSLPMIREAARSVLRGERHPLIGNATFFHTAGYSFPYDNMHYVLVTGGNAFYEKRNSHLVTRPVPPLPIEGITGR